MPVAAGVVTDLDLGTAFTTQYMPTELGAAAPFDRRHHLELAEVEVSRPGSTPGRTAGTEDIRDL
jgi:hypothetical protein